MFVNAGGSVGAHGFATNHDHTVPLNPRIMSAQISHLTGVPIEILEQIFLHLPDRDMVKMDEVRRVMVNPAQFCADLPPA